jgi:autotransporter-associated beta strand protein
VVTFTGGAFDIRGSLVSPLTVAVTDVVEDWNVTVGETVSSIDTSTRTGSSRLVKHGSGSLVLDRANSHTGGVLVTAGEIIVRHLSALGTGILEVRAGAKVTLDIGSVNWNGGTNFIVLAGISLDPAGHLEVGTGQISVAAGNYDLDSIRSAISSGRNGGQWNGLSGFTSAAAGRGTFRAIGYRVMPATNELRLGFAAFGDTNLDGRITTIDIALVNNAGRFGQGTSASTTWADGDFNYDGRVSSIDIGLLNNTGLFGKGSYLPVAPAASSLQTAVATAGATISSDTWAAYALAGESMLGKKKKR